MKYFYLFLFLLSLLAGYWVLNWGTTSAADDYFPHLKVQRQWNIEHHKRLNRSLNLTNFFNHYHAPVIYNSDYIHAAELNHIDYRLLPAISIAESSGGKHACSNNWWGWNSCKGYNFRSVAEGIRFVDDKLANGNYYKGKPLIQKLHSYNPNPAYAVKINGFMKEISNASIQ